MERMSRKKSRKLGVVSAHTQLAPDIFAVRLYRFRRNPERGRDFLGAVPCPDKTADIEFRQGQSGQSPVSGIRVSPVRPSIRCT